MPRRKWYIGFHIGLSKGKLLLHREFGRMPNTTKREREILRIKMKITANKNT